MFTITNKLRTIVASGALAAALAAAQTFENEVQNQETLDNNCGVVD